MANMWQYDPVKNLDSDYRFLNPGGTSTDEVNLDGQKIILKNEHENPSGSFKDRSLAFQIGYYLSQGKDRFTISSSGNAAISAAIIALKAGCNLDVYVAESVSEKKLKLLLEISRETTKIKIIKCRKPKSEAIKSAFAKGSINLRGSKDDNAVQGFMTIADEVLESFPGIDAVFIPTSSATSALAIGQRFLELGKKVAVHVCQNTRIHPIAKEFDFNFNATTTSIADCVVDRVAFRKSSIVDLVRKTAGSGWVLSDSEIIAAKDLLSKKLTYDYSFNSVLAVAGILKAKQNGFNYNISLAIMSGR